eukprot:CAMPEP_0172590044 /NCGR_PEP_ID=MMETSP1068-20121228/8525_1 /TAXON_ID=35684 /ORGANISM="Pseudopedinella elastica, Strain CCMP716" /LENGTH=267 /DNA_ID=CAMNT_0013385731 /DNA_START=65 /DNA_END=868 /DNA_ORIENTATION=-
MFLGSLLLCNAWLVSAFISRVELGGPTRRRRPTVRSERYDELKGQGERTLQRREEMKKMYEEISAKGVGYLGSLEGMARKYDELLKEGENTVAKREEMRRMYEQAFKDGLGYLGDLEMASRKYEELREEGEKTVQRREELRKMYEEAVSGMSGPPLLNLRPGEAGESDVENAARLEALRVQGVETVKLREERKTLYLAALEDISKEEQAGKAVKYEALRKEGEDAIKQRGEKRKLYEEAAKDITPEPKPLKDLLMDMDAGILKSLRL